MRLFKEDINSKRANLASESRFFRDINLIKNLVIFAEGELEMNKKEYEDLGKALNQIDYSEINPEITKEIS